MVTFRREMTDNTDKGLTNYDLFMLKKAGTRDAAVEEFERRNSGVSDDPYKAYLLAQLAESKEGALTETEFYHLAADKAQKISHNDKTAVQTAAKRRLSKGGRIFLTIYVLTVGLIASIILALNTDGSRHQAQISNGADTVAVTSEAEESLLERLFG